MTVKRHVQTPIMHRHGCKNRLLRARSGQDGSSCLFASGIPNEDCKIQIGIGCRTEVVR